MRKNLKELTSYYISRLCLLLLFFSQACYEPREGCLDINATNFQTDADKDCLDCCTYPELNLSFRHRVVLPDTAFNLVYLDSVYTDDFGNPFTIKNIQFYLSNFHLIRASGDEVGVVDSLEFEIPQTDGDPLVETVEDNFALINRSTFSDYTLGTFLESNDFAALRFAIGVEGQANNADPNSINENHPLYFQDEEMHFNIDSGYVFNKIELFRDTTVADTIPVIIDIGLEQNLRAIVLPAVFSLVEGFDITVVLQVDYLTWFEGVDVKNDTPEEIASKIVQNITQAFSIIEIIQN